MQVQTIYNIGNYNKNISCKAYFKQNEALENLCKKAKKTEELAEFIQSFKTKTPNHELEIIEIRSVQNRQGFISCDILNYTTEKIMSIVTSAKEKGLWGILAHLNLYRDSDFFRIDEEEIDIDCLSILTKKD